jgi:hypothetical protein
LFLTDLTAFFSGASMADITGYNMVACIHERFRRYLVEHMMAIIWRSNTDTKAAHNSEALHQFGPSVLPPLIIAG